jgi:SAM-dependent methyltransferase
MDNIFSYTNHIKHYQLDGEFYDFFSPDKFMLQEIRRRYQQIFNLFPVNQNHSILEIGSGGGFAIDFLKKNQPRFFPMDIPNVNLYKMKSHSPFPIYPCSADAYHLPFSSSSFDLVLLLEVIEHLATPQKVLEEVHRVLKSKGKIILSVPYKEKITYQICIHCKVPNRLHFNILTRKLPFALWKIFDGIFNALIDKPLSLITLGQKQE